ncbi:hypothetical protein X551_04708 [Methylibium sp. T29]|nr:hypothetical protein X551_04708 [Methylibium sp. T29]
MQDLGHGVFKRLIYRRDESRGSIRHLDDLIIIIVQLLAEGDPNVVNVDRIGCVVVGRSKQDDVCDAKSC